MTVRKVDLAEVDRLLRTGLSMREAGRRLGVNAGTISRAAAKMRATSNEAAISKSQGVNSVGLDEERLRKILATLERQLEAAVRMTDESSSGRERREWVKALATLSREVRQAAAEVRSTISVLYGAREVQRFEAVVLEKIAEVDGNVRNQIIRALEC